MYAYNAKRPRKTKQALKVSAKRVKMRNKLNNAIRRGDVKRKPCEVCGKAKTEAHHTKYNGDTKNTLRWLCRKHHLQVHSR